MRHNLYRWLIQRSVKDIKGFSHWHTIMIFVDQSITLIERQFLGLEFTQIIPWDTTRRWIQTSYFWVEISLQIDPIIWVAIVTGFRIDLNIYESGYNLPICRASRWLDTCTTTTLWCVGIKRQDVDAEVWWSILSIGLAWIKHSELTQWTRTIVTVTSCISPGFCENENEANL